MIYPLPSTTDPRRFGVDCYYGQGMIDFEKLTDYKPDPYPPVEFIVPRAGISWGYQDKFFPYFWEHAKEYEILRMCYHVLYPLESPARQVDNLMRILGDNLPEGPIVWDVELIHNATKTQITDAAWAVVSMTYDRVGVWPIIYTRPYFVRDHMLTHVDWYRDVYWWMAHYYYSGQEPPDSAFVTLMNQANTGIPLDNVLFVQTSEKGDGKALGATSYKIDYDRFRGTMGQWMEIWDFNTPTPPPSYPIELTESERDSVLSMADKLS